MAATILDRSDQRKPPPTPRVAEIVRSLLRYHRASSGRSPRFTALLLSVELRHVTNAEASHAIRIIGALVRTGRLAIDRDALRSNLAKRRLNTLLEQRVLELAA